VRDRQADGHIKGGAVDAALAAGDDFDDHGIPPHDTKDRAGMAARSFVSHGFSQNPIVQ
jgi:hypothetical protein